MNIDSLRGAGIAFSIVSIGCVIGAIFCFTDFNVAGGLALLCLALFCLLPWWVYFRAKKLSKKEKQKKVQTFPAPTQAKPQISQTSRSTTLLSKEQEQGKWCFSIEKIGEIAKQLYKTSVSESYEEQLDYAINFGFHFYSSICFIRRDLNFATAFLDWYKYFLKHDWQAPHEFDQAYIVDFVNTRFTAYKSILKYPTHYIENEQRLEEALFRFILNDRAGSPFTSEETEIPIYEMFSLKHSISPVYIETLEKTKAQCDYVIGTSFYIQYTGD